MPPHNPKRPRHDKERREKEGPVDGGDEESNPQATTAPALALTNNPFMPMFTLFRDELDEHHDRRERVIKASRDITALSKKM